MKKPTAPSGPKPEGGRPAGGVSLSNGKETNGESVAIPVADLRRICEALRNNTLVGPEAAAALEEAAGLPPPSPPGKPAKELRAKCAAFRADDAEVIPDVVEEKPSAGERAGRHASFDAGAAEGHDIESLEHHVVEKDAPEPPELNLNPKQNQLRTNLEMWVMDEIPVLYGVDDSEELPESLQEDAQAYKITELIAQDSKDLQAKMLGDWLKDPPDAEARDELANLIMEKVGKIQEAGQKKKKKKKAAS